MNGTETGASPVTLQVEIQHDGGTGTWTRMVGAFASNLIKHDATHDVGAVAICGFLYPLGAGWKIRPRIQHIGSAPTINTDEGYLSIKMLGWSVPSGDNLVTVGGDNLVTVGGDNIVPV